MNETTEHQLKASRRTFLGVSAIAAGTLVLGGLPTYAAKIVSDEKQTLPWQPMPYVKLDPQVTRERSYNAYYQWKS